MARAIRQRPPARTEERGTPTELLANDLEGSVESLRSFLELLRLLDERGLLRFSTGLLKEEEHVISVLTERLEPGEVRATLRNVEVLVRAFRDVDPETLRGLASGVPRALEEAHRAQEDRPVGWLEVMSTLRDPDVNRGVRMVLGFLRGIGQAAHEEA
jgi:uncharacterized protein YjgD (DUF1641 family)